MHQRAAVFLSVAFLALGSAGQSQVRPVDDSRAPKLHSQMVRLLRERGPSKGWIFFADKGLVEQAELERAIQRLTPGSLQRRALRRSMPGLVDDHDVAVNASYIGQVLASGVTLSVTSRWLNAISVLGTETQFRTIAAMPFVERIEPVRRGIVMDAEVGRLGETQINTAAPLGGGGSFYGEAEVQLKQLNLLAVHDLGFRGEGVVIGILDTGFHRGHEAFNQPGHVVDIIAEYDFVNDDGNAGIEMGDPFSQHSHGTYILGTLAAYLPGQLVGAAYEASFILCKTEDITDEYEGEEDFFVAGLEFIELNGADVITSSLGYIDWYEQSDLDGLTAVTTVAANIATANGIHMCNAAGNSSHDADPGTSALIAPSDGLEVIAVGAVDGAGLIASFSSDGPSADLRVKPELLARGVDTATVCAFTDMDCIAGVNGTSLSTPVMAGAVACMTGAFPTWSCRTMRRNLMRVGDYFEANETFDPFYVLGFGIPDVYRAGFRPVTPVASTGNGGTITPR